MKEYDITSLDANMSSYDKGKKKQITIKINNNTIDYFRDLSEKVGIPYQTLMNLYLTECAESNRKLKMVWA
ncbi:BrnA antitoxin family protein [Butyrivibrio sp. AE3004]|uniref:BrnA antitoxin family protein n=1 Tax=Butyrivibrio sp. AE3004 TaxID=1506994 RepID=UPI001FA75F61|nr:BrnA antitoxin family protein [Butyrivibrio sp. AE3004]